MKQWIRWPGLIGFVVVVVVVAALWFLFMDSMVRRVIERTGTSLVGAEVDLAAAHVTLVPLGITLSGLQVTDPAAPTTNSFEISRIAFELDSLNLLRRKVIINEMGVEGVRFGTARKRPGTVVKPPEKTAPPEGDKTSALPTFSTPDVKKILEEEKLESPALIEQTQAEIKKKNETWKQQAASMPDKAALDDYQARVQKLKDAKKGGLKALAGGLSDAKALTKDLQRDLDKVKKAKADLAADLAAAKALVEKAEQAPAADLRRIRDKYSISAEGLQNLSQSLFGGAIRSWVDRGMMWYGRLKPVLERSGEKKGNVETVKPVRGRGVDVRFREARPLPDFLISTVKASLQPEAGTFTGTIRNITPDQDVLGIPLTFAFTGSGLKEAQAANVTGTLDHRKPALPDDTVLLKVSGYRVSNIALSGAASMPVSLQDGTMDLEVKGKRDAKALSAVCTAQVKGARLNVGSDGSGGAFAQAIRSSLAKVSSFSLTANIMGTPEKYQVRISSDLDRVLRDAAGGVVREHRDRLEKELRQAIQEKTDKQLAGLKGDLGGLGDTGGKLDGVQDRLNNMIKEAGSSAGSKLKLR
ncbi:MAG: TIGR03545 family protein [Nitrospirota bacterium]